MTAISISINRGVLGFAISDFTIGTSAPGTGDVELRFNTTDGQGAPETLIDVISALKAFRRALDRPAATSLSSRRRPTRANVDVPLPH